MAKVQRTASKVAWSLKRQAAFGTPLAKTDLTRFIKLADPIKIDENPEHWSDRGMIGNGHDWETTRGILRQTIKLEIPMQAMPIDFAGYLIAQFCGITFATNNTGSYTHQSILANLGIVPVALPFSLAIQEDGNDYCVQDIAITNLTIKGEGSTRLEMSATLIGTKKTTLDTYTWPSAATMYYAWANAGTYTRATVDKKTELKSFELSLSNGIDVDGAFEKVAAEADRIYPNIWRHTPDRNVTLKTSILAEAAALATYRGYQQAGTEEAIVITCVGVQIGTSGEYYTLSINLPKGVYTAVDYQWQKGLLVLDLTAEGHYDSTAGAAITEASRGGPLVLEVTNADAAYLVAAS